MDPSIAVGPNSILLTTNSGLWLLNRDGTEIVDPVTLEQFFGTFSGVDTVSFYDVLSARFFVLNAYVGDLRLAVSQSDAPDLDPENWYFYQWDLPGEDGADYPDLSVSEDYVYITCILNGSPVGRARIFFVPKAGLLIGQQPEGDGFGIGPDQTYENGPFRAISAFHSYDDTGSIGYFITDLRLASQQSDKIRLYAVNPDATPDPTLDVFDLEVDEYYGAPPKVAIPDDADVTCNWNFNKQPVIRNGSAWATLAIGPENPAQEAKTSKVRWYEIDMNGWPVSDFDPEVAQSGTINPSANISAFYPTLHVDDDGSMAIAYNQCSASEHISIRRAIRKWYDDPGELRSTLVLKQSESSPSGLGNAWADYTEMDEDPEYPGVMWSHLMWFEGTSTRKTWVGRTDLNHSLTLEIDYEGEEIPRGTLVELTVNGAAPDNLIRWYWSTDGCGSTYIQSLNVTLGVNNAQFLGSGYADSTGAATKQFTVPSNFDLGPVDVQAAELENTSAIIRRVIIEQ